jgi:nitrous oxidase accessory protein
MKRKWLAVGIILLFIGTSVIPLATSEQAQSKTIITVDDDGDGDYTSIKDALNHSSPGDTIEVYSGTYQENEIHITAQGLILQGIPYELGNGNDTGKPVVTSSENFTTFFLVPGYSITITGFIINDSSVLHKDTYPIKIWGDNCTFSDNTIIGGAAALYIGNLYYNPINTRIIDNTIQNTRTGIVYGGQYGNISRNSISRCTRSGIVMQDEGSFNTISHNTIQNCNDTGIEFYNNSDSIISYNLISDVHRGIFLGAEGAKNISIMMNQLQDCGMGICMEFLQSLIDVHQNNFIDNSVDIRIIQHLQLQNNFLSHRILDENYYDSWRGFGSKFILGFTIIYMIPLFMPDMFFFIPVIMLRIYRDKNPAQEPYDIPGMS